MDIASVDDILRERGLAPPQFRALIPNRENYKVLLCQPGANITTDSDGVRNSDPDIAQQQFSAYLHIAVENDVDLAVTPEYSLPWKVLEDAVRGGTKPADGKLWVLGCESLKPNELAALADRLSGQVTFIYEKCDGDQSRFLNPVVYLFQVPSIDGTSDSQTVALIQFKTCALGDNQNYEVDHLLLGTRLYFFGGAKNQLRLITLICSDAFDFTDKHARELYDRTLIIHIQLNQNPRQHQFRTYRTHLFQYDGHETELITLNWARDIYADIGEGPKCWQNIAGTGWYLRPNRFDTGDQKLQHNHRLGLYYTWLDPEKCHALFFSYEPAVFLLTATKVAHVAVTASLSRRIGPKMEATLRWNSKSLSWEETPQVDDGFVRIVSNAGNAEGDLKALVQTNPLAVERLLALCDGSSITEEDWYRVTKLDSCRIEATEIIKRVTFCHDTIIEADQFRQARVRACQRAARIISQSLPPSLSDLQTGYRFEWNERYPHANITSTSGRCATVIALDNTRTREDAQKIRDTLAEYMRRKAETENDSLEAQQRLHVWYQDDEKGDILYDPHRYTHYDQTPAESSFDIGRAY
ncbi:hypothetical protein [Gimesia algae]|uniref:Uncharacterized protein n=1 Tax=Gimesia algae TaxID=2527971 RepID=A0A517V722_9PLAN|nr:hypothetical protein [Gimesia algae]QDT88797.1 hypothetical protein Pan161_04160 [Gimesia algae]